MTDIHGDVDEGFGAVADAFREGFVERKEIGAACAVFRGGRPVVDLWGGHRDKARTLPWERDTMVTVFSTTKGMAATAMAVAHSRGLYELDEPVASYWPDFAQAGKERVTVRQLLGHEAGLAVIDVPLDLATIADADRLGAVLAAQAPRWAPGTTHGYHAQTLGWYESQLLRRVDPQGRSIGRFFADEIAAPLGVELHIGVPDDVADERIATFVMGGKVAAVLHAHQMPKRLLASMFNPRSMTARAFSNPKVLANDLGAVNRREVRRLELPSMNGTGEVRAIARVYGALAAGGEELGVTSATLAEIEREQPPAFDQIFRLESAFSCGFMKPFPILPFGTSPRAFGHTGMGGSFGFADPDTCVGYAYAMNRGGFSLPTDPREIALREAVFRCL